MIKIKHNGDVSIAILSLFMIILLSLMLMFTIFHKVLINRLDKVQDDVALSNLAVYKNVDIDALAVDEKNLRISDAAAALETFKKHLKVNMKLDDNLNGLDGSTADGQVSIDEFTIYNVNGNLVDILTYSPNTHMFTESTSDKSLVKVKTSNGIIVRNTSVHATISYNIKLLFGQIKLVTASVDTDIVK